MTLSFWEYLRRRTAEAVLAGCHDALDILEIPDQSAAIWAAAKALRKQLNEGLSRVPSTNGQAPGAPSANHPSAPLPKPNPSPPTVGPLPGQRPPNATSPPLPERRKVGRPRKEVHG